MSQDNQNQEFANRRTVISTSDDLPWCRWPWDRCRAYTPEYEARCDLKRGHQGFNHVADRGMHNVIWSSRWEDSERTDVNPYGRREQLCNEKQPGSMREGVGVTWIACDRRIGHDGKHTWEMS